MDEIDGKPDWRATFLAVTMQHAHLVRLEGACLPTFGSCIILNSMSRKNSTTTIKRRCSLFVCCAGSLVAAGLHLDPDLDERPRTTAGGRLGFSQPWGREIATAAGASMEQASG